MPLHGEVGTDTRPAHTSAGAGAETASGGGSTASDDETELEDGIPNEIDGLVLFVPGPCVIRRPKS